VTHLKTAVVVKQCSSGCSIQPISLISEADNWSPGQLYRWLVVRHQMLKCSAANVWDWSAGGQSKSAEVHDQIASVICMASHYIAEWSGGDLISMTCCDQSSVVSWRSLQQYVNHRSSTMLHLHNQLETTSSLPRDALSVRGCRLLP